MTEKANIKEYLRRRRETDYIMPIWLPFLPFILGLLGLFGFLGSVFAFAASGSRAGIMLGSFSILILIALLIAGAIISLYVIYKWIQRRNNHFNRLQMLNESFTNYLEEKASSRDIDISNITSNIKRDIRDAEREETEKNSILYIILYLVFNPVLLYIFHFLNKDFVNHAHREEDILEGFNRALEKLGVEEKIRAFSKDRIPERNTIIYIVLSFVTLGIFIFYWVYTLTIDPNEHFKEHQTIEKEINEIVEKLD